MEFESHRPASSDASDLNADGVQPSMVDPSERSGISQPVELGRWDDAANRFDPTTDQAASLPADRHDTVLSAGNSGTTNTADGLIGGNVGAEPLIDTDSDSATTILMVPADSPTIVGSVSSSMTASDADGSMTTSTVTLADTIDAPASSPDSAVPNDDPTSSAGGESIADGSLTVQQGAVFIAPAALAGGPIWNDGTIELTAASAIPTGQIDGDGTVLIDSGFETSVAYAGTFDAGPNLGVEQHLCFNGPNASLFITNGANDPSTPILVENFQPLDDLSVSGSVQSLQVVSTADGDLLELVEQVGGVHGSVSTQYIQFDQSYAAENLTFSADLIGTGAFGSGYTNITVSEATACFCPGTLIATPTGECPVEDLRIGDAVCTVDGPDQPVLWIGRRSYHRRFVTGRADLLPIRLRAGALGAGLPRRDLFVSPKHAMLVKGVLVPAELLVNGRSVVQREVDSDVDYLHVELDNQALLIAEGAATESFVDDNSRAMFDNAADYALLYPNRPCCPPRWGAPRVEHGEHLLSAQTYVNALAGILPQDARPALSGQVDAIGSGRVRGWAWCPERPHAPVLLDVLLNDVLMTQVLADGYRADLADAGIGTGCHGFEAVVPEGAGSVTVRRARDGAPLAA